MLSRSKFSWSLPVALAAGALCLTLGGGAAQAGPGDPVVLNGSFESPSIGLSAYSYSPAVPNWTFSGLSGLASNGALAFLPTVSAPDGTQVVFLQAYNNNFSGAAGGISQSIGGFVTGQTYTISVYLAERATVSAGTSVVVSLNDVAIQTIAAPTTTSFQQYLVTFTASSSTELLAFVAGSATREGQDVGTLMDMVTVAKGTISTMEPASLSVLGMGLVGLVAIRRRRASTTA